MASDKIVVVPQTLMDAEQYQGDFARALEANYGYLQTHCRLDGAFGLLMLPMENRHNQARDLILKNFEALKNIAIASQNGLRQALKDYSDHEQKVIDETCKLGTQINGDFSGNSGVQINGPVTINGNGNSIGGAGGGGNPGGGSAGGGYGGGSAAGGGGAVGSGSVGAGGPDGSTPHKPPVLDQTLPDFPDAPTPPTLSAGGTGGDGSLDSQPGEPTHPVEPTHPGESVDPTDPGAGVSPVDPAVPVDPNEGLPRNWDEIVANDPLGRTDAELRELWLNREAVVIIAPPKSQIGFGYPEEINLNVNVVSNVNVNINLDSLLREAIGTSERSNA